MSANDAPAEGNGDEVNRNERLADREKWPPWDPPETPPFAWNNRAALFAECIARAPDDWTMAEIVRHHAQAAHHGDAPVRFNVSNRPCRAGGCDETADRVLVYSLGADQRRLWFSCADCVDDTIDKINRVDDYSQRVGEVHSNRRLPGLSI